MKKNSSGSISSIAKGIKVFMPFPQEYLSKSERNSASLNSLSTMSQPNTLASLGNWNLS